MSSDDCKTVGELPSENARRSAAPRNRFSRVYSVVAVYVLNTFLLLLAVNLILAVLFALRAGTWTGMFVSPVRWELAWSRRNLSWDPEAFTALTPAQAQAFMKVHREMIASGFDYRPWVQFRHRPFAGDGLNLDAEGFRITPHSVTDGGRQPIYVFGGSTTFGTGVPDEFTTPARLQAILDETNPGAFYVRNYGQSYYYSSQELELFLELLRRGERPRFAIFIDGLNDTAQTAKGIDQPWFTGTLAEAWDRMNGRAPSGIPMIRLAQGLRRRLAGIRPPESPPRPDLSDGERAGFAVDRYLSNQRIIRTVCAEYGITPLFVWQPVPFYKFDRRLTVTHLYPGPIPRFWTMVYDRMAQIAATDYLYLGNMLEQTREKVFVDDLHYNEKFNGAIAEVIAERIQQVGR